MIQDLRDRHNKLIERLSNAESVVPPNKVGTQFYCEQKTVMEREHGDISTPEKEIGSEVHDKAAEDARRMDDDELWHRLEEDDQLVLVESGFVGEVCEFLIPGIPDVVLFEQGMPKLVIDRKTTSYPWTTFDNQEIQTWLYGRILDSLGFDVNELYLGILGHEQTLDFDFAKELQRICCQTYVSMDMGPNQLHESPDAVFHLWAYDQSQFEDELSRGFEFWRGERDALPTDNPNKCKGCEYSDICPESLV